jgi:hypothetical protein
MDTLDWVGPLLKPCSIVLAIMAVIWGLLEYLFWWLPDKVRRPLSYVLGQALTFWVHESGLYSFGDGPPGWAIVVVLGAATAPLASVFLDKMVAKFAPWAKREAVVDAVKKVAGSSPSDSSQPPAPPAGGQP